jgi:cell division protein FtsQ
MKRPDFPLTPSSPERRPADVTLLPSRRQDAKSTRPKRAKESPPKSRPARKAEKQSSTRKTRETGVARRQREEAADARMALREARKARKAFERNEVRRFTARVRRRRQAWAAALVSLLAVGVFVVVGVFSPVMRVQTITVTGTTRVDPAAISGQLTDQIGQPLPLVDIGRIEEVLRRQTLIESYSIESRPPNGLILHVVERQPIVYIPVGTKFELIDAAGVTIESTPENPGDYPLIRVPKDEAKGVAYAAAIEVLQSLPADLRSRISEISASTADDVTYVFGDTGQRVFWGSSDDAALKVRALSGLLANWPPGTANEYDVSSKDNVVVR